MGGPIKIGVEPHMNWPKELFAKEFELVTFSENSLVVAKLLLDLNIIFGKDFYVIMGIDNKLK